MRVFLANSAIVRNSGTYEFRLIGKDEFVRIANEAARIESFIGYPDTARMLSDMLGFEVPVNRAMLPQFEPGDVVLGCRLKYRVPNPKDKGKFTPGVEDFEFWTLTFKG